MFLYDKKVYKLVKTLLFLLTVFIYDSNDKS